MRLARVGVCALGVALVASTLSALAPGGLLEQAAAVVPSPPAPVVPARAITEVTAPGPTSVSGQITVDTVWGPTGSPYVVTGSVAVMPTASLTVLPGTEIRMGASTSINVSGQIQLLGTRNDHVTVTGSTSTPGSWGGIRVLPQLNQERVPLSLFDYVDFSYGGDGTDGACRDDGMLSAGRNARVLVTNSTFRDAEYVGLSDGTNSEGYFGVYRNTFSDSHCGVANWGARADYVDNTFEGGFGNFAFLSVSGVGRFWFNDVHGDVGAEGDELSIHYNGLDSVKQFGAWSQQLQDWRFNEWEDGLREEPAVPPCADPETFEDIQPPVVGFHWPDCIDDNPYPYWYGANYRLLVHPGGGNTRHVPESMIRPYHAQFGGVNTTQGTLTYATSDLAVEDAGAQIQAGRNYSSSVARASASDVGRGWRTSFSEAMTPQGALPTFTLSDDGEVPLSDPDSPTVYPGVAATLETSAAGSVVSTPDHTAYEFDPNGELVGMVLGDARHRLDIDRAGGKVASVTGVSGRGVTYQRSGTRLEGFEDSNGREVAFDYDTDGRLTSATGVDGQTETYEYAGDTARLTRVVSAEGVARLAAGYDEVGRVEWVEPEGSGRFTIDYDTDMRTITRPDGVEVVQTLDGEGRLVSETVEGGSGRHLVYDGDGRMVAEVSGVPSMPMAGYSAPSSGTLIDVGSGSKNLRWLEIDPLGRVTTTTLNERQDPVEVIGPGGVEALYGYNAQHRVDVFVDARGGEYELTYGQYGQVESVTDPAGRTAEWVYQSDGDLDSTTSFLGGTSTHTTNGRGLVTASIDPFGGTTEVGYTSWGAVSTITRPRGGVSTATFDADRRVTAVEDAGGNTISYDYDSRGRLANMVDPLEQSTSFGYDLNGRPESRTDAGGNTFTQTYTPEGWTATIDGPGNVTSETEYDPAGRPVWITDGLDRVTQNVYDRAGQVLRTDTPDGGHRSWTYDEAGWPATYTNARDGVTEYEFDPAGDLTKITDPADGIETRTYDNLGRPTGIILPGSGTLTYSYSNHGRTTTVADTLGQRSISTTDTAGRLTSHTDGVGAITEFGYNPDGLLASRTAPGQPPVTYGYNLAGQLTSQTDERGNTVQATYDDAGRLATRTWPDASVEEFDYDANGNLVDRRDRTGNWWAYEFDDLNRLVTATDPLDAATSYDYDAVGNLVETTDPTGVTNRVAYDPMDRPAVLTDDADNPTVHTYDLEGNLLTSTDPDGRVVTHQYDALNRPTKRTYSGVIGLLSMSWDPAGNLLSATRDSKTFSWTYDARNRVTSSTDALGKQTDYDYDLADQLVERTSPTGRDTTFDYTPAGYLDSTTIGGRTADYSYFPGGLLKRLELPSGAHYAYTYDQTGQLDTQTDPEQLLTAYDYQDGLLTGVTRPDQTQVTYDYDDAGRLITHTAGSSSRSYGYDDAGRMTSATTSGAGGATSLTMTYDSRGLLASSADAAGTTAYTHDASGYVDTLTPPSGGALTFTRNDAGQTATVRGPVNLNYSYDKWGRLTGRSQATGTSNATINLSYDKNGRPLTTASGTNKQTATYDDDGLLATLQTNLTSVTNTAEGTQTFTRDTGGRLTGYSLVSNTGTPIAETTYGWDDDSNRTSLTHTPAGGTAATTTAAHDDAGRIDTLTTPGGVSDYTHDDNGQLTGIDRPGTGQDATYGYDDFGELTSASVTLPGGGTAQVAYTRDAFGRVTQRTQTGGTNPGTTSYGYRATQPEPTSTSSGTSTTSLVRDPAGTLLAAKTATGSISHTVPNVHGDLMAWRAQTGGSYTQTQIYDPFGNPTTTTTTGGPGAELGIGFQTQPTDPATGLVDMNARAYDPATGTFTSADTWPGNLTDPVTLNRYTYGNASPVDFTDPTGHFSIPIVTTVTTWIKNALQGAAHAIRGAVSSAAARATSYGHALTQAAIAQAKSFQTQLASSARELAGGAQGLVNDFRSSLRPHSDEAHAALATLGLGFDGADLIDAAWYLLIDGDAKNALISFGAMIPVAGAAVAGGRLLRHSDEATGVARWATRGTPIRRTATLPTSRRPAAAVTDQAPILTGARQLSYSARRLDLGAGGFRRSSVGSAQAMEHMGGGAFRNAIGRPQDFTRSLETSPGLNPIGYITGLASDAGINLRGVRIVYDETLPVGVYGRTLVQEGGWTIRVGPDAIAAGDGQVVNTIAHELSHARYLQKHGSFADEVHGNASSLGDGTPYGSGNACQAWWEGRC